LFIFSQIFTEKSFRETIRIPIINDNQYYPDTDFYVILKHPTGDAALGDPSVTRVTIIDDDSKLFMWCSGKGNAV